MQVETFEVLEAEEQMSVQADEETRAIVDALNLEGQSKLYKGGENVDVPLQARVPYREMTRAELNVYTILFPSKTEIRKYGEQPIPLRILQVAAHAEAECWFKRLEVWHQDSMLTKDPLLVGIRRGENTWDDRPCLLGRWGDALEEFPILAMRAAQVWKEKTMGKLREHIARAQMDLAIVEKTDAPPIDMLSWTPPAYGSYSSLGRR